MKIWLFQMFKFYKRVPGASYQPRKCEKDLVRLSLQACGKKQSVRFRTYCDIEKGSYYNITAP